MTNSTARLRRLTTREITKGANMPAIPVREIPNIVDVNSLEGVKVKAPIYNRGVEIARRGRVKVNSLYPWKFTVSGDRGPLGSTLYFVDLSQMSCSCLWNQNTGGVCKHMVAALLTHMKARHPRV